MALLNTTVRMLAAAMLLATGCSVALDTDGLTFDGGSSSDAGGTGPDDGGGVPDRGGPDTSQPDAGAIEIRVEQPGTGDSCKVFADQPGGGAPGEVQPCPETCPDGGWRFEFDASGTEGPVSSWNWSFGTPDEPHRILDESNTDQAVATVTVGFPPGRQPTECDELAEEGGFDVELVVNGDPEHSWQNGFEFEVAEGCGGTSCSKP